MEDISNDALHALMEEIKNDDKEAQEKKIEEFVNGLEEGEALAQRKKILPQNKIVKGMTGYTCMSVVNYADKYHKRFLLTSLIGYLYRKCDEYCLDDGEKPIHLDNYEEFMKEYELAHGCAITAREMKKSIYSVIDNLHVNYNFIIKCLKEVIMYTFFRTKLIIYLTNMIASL